VNLPLPKGYGNLEFLAIFERLLRPMALEFNPDLILVSAGFDIHTRDPMGKMQVNADGFAGLTRSLMKITELCHAKLALCLEGGYHVDALTKSVRAVVRELADASVTPVENLAAGANKKMVDFAVKRTVHVHQHTWKGLSL